MKNTFLLLNVILLSSAACAMQQLTDEHKQEIVQKYTNTLHWVYVEYKQGFIGDATQLAKGNSQLATDLNEVSGAVNLRKADETVQQKLDALSTKWGLDRFDLNKIKLNQK